MKLKKLRSSVGRSPKAALQFKMQGAQAADRESQEAWADATPWQALKNTFQPWSIRIILLLGVFVFISALAVVWVKDQYRQRYIQLQAAYQERDHLQTVWGQLLLEESTWAQYQRIEKIATGSLGMIVPVAKDIRIVE